MDVYRDYPHVTWHQPCTCENFHFHYALHFTFEDMKVKNWKKQELCS